MAVPPCPLPGASVATLVDPTAVLELSGPVRAALSFVLVSVFGGAVLYRWGELVDRSIDAVMDRPAVAVLYGLVAYLLVVVVGAYALTQIARLAVAGVTVGALGVASVGVAVMLLSGMGFLVVGTLLTDLQGRRRPVYGLLVGATLSALTWLLLPLWGGAALWVGVAAFGIGGSTREWIHSERTVQSELDG